MSIYDFENDPILDSDLLFDTPELDQEFLPLLWEMLFDHEEVVPSPTATDADAHLPFTGIKSCGSPTSVASLKGSQQYKANNTSSCKHDTSRTLEHHRHHEKSPRKKFRDDEDCPCIPRRETKTCAHKLCEKIAPIGSYCSKHGGRRICQVDGCSRVDRGRGLCGSHGGGRRCKVEGCDKASRKHGMCSTHLRQSNAL